MSDDFTTVSVSVSGAPDITFTIAGDTIRAELAGAKIYAETRGDGGADLRLTDHDGEVLADLVVNVRHHRTMTENVIDVGSALLWSHWRYKQAMEKMAEVVGIRTPDGVDRCVTCRLPLATSREQGCVPGDCSYRGARP